MKNFIAAIFLLIPILTTGQIACDNRTISPEFNDEPLGCILCDGSISFNNDGYTPDEIEVTLPGSEVENSIWFSFYTNENGVFNYNGVTTCLLYTSPSPRDRQKSRMPSSA